VILSFGALLRVGLMLLLAVVLQLSALSQLGIVGGGQVDLVVLVVAAVAFYGGSVSGCATGFAAGFLLDLATGATMGASSLVLTAVGYGVGRFKELHDPSHGLLPIPVGAAATAGWVVAFAAVSFMLDVGARVSPLVFRDMVVTVLLNALLALPVFTACRKVLRPSLRVDPVEVRRRREQQVRETGPLGLRGMEV
jgi:rod shape-determining protein MreD